VAQIPAYESNESGHEKRGYKKQHKGQQGLQASKPFIIVFVEVPENLTKDTAKPVRSSVGQQASDFSIAQAQPRIST